MKPRIPSTGNSYERLAINLAELIHDLDGDQEDLLRDLLISAYKEAYRKAVIVETEPVVELAATG
jgi:DNA-binding protein YbaB